MRTIDQLASGLNQVTIHPSVSLSKEVQDSECRECDLCGESARLTKGLCKGCRDFHNIEEKSNDH